MMNGGLGCTEELNGHTTEAARHLYIAYRTRISFVDRICICVPDAVFVYDFFFRLLAPRKQGNLEKWIKPLADGSVGVAAVNLASTAADVRVNAADLGLEKNVSSARDLCAHADVSCQAGTYIRTVASHDVLMLRIK